MGQPGGHADGRLPFGVGVSRPTALKLGCAVVAWLAVAAVAGLGVLVWIGDTKTNRQAAAEMERRLRDMGVGPWIDSGTFIVRRAPLGSFASDRRYASLELAAPDSDALLAAVGQKGWTLTSRKPATLPSEFGVREQGLTEYEFLAPQKNDIWWFYASSDRAVVYINNFGS